MAARFFTRLSIVLMCNLKVFDAVEQANRMTDADQETRDGAAFDFQDIISFRGNRYTARLSHERYSTKSTRSAQRRVIPLILYSII